MSPRNFPGTKSSRPGRSAMNGIGMLFDGVKSGGDMSGVRLTQECCDPLRVLKELSTLAQQGRLTPDKARFDLAQIDAFAREAQTPQSRQTIQREAAKFKEAVLLSGNGTLINVALKGLSSIECLKPEYSANVFSKDATSDAKQFDSNTAPREATSTPFGAASFTNVGLNFLMGTAPVSEAPRIASEWCCLREFIATYQKEIESLAKKGTLTHEYYSAYKRECEQKLSQARLDGEPRDIIEKVEGIVRSVDSSLRSDPIAATWPDFQAAPSREPHRKEDPIFVAADPQPRTEPTAAKVENAPQSAWSGPAYTIPPQVVVEAWYKHGEPSHIHDSQPMSMLKGAQATASAELHPPYRFEPSFGGGRIGAYSHTTAIAITGSTCGSSTPVSMGPLPLKMSQGVTSANLSDLRQAVRQLDLSAHARVERFVARILTLCEGPVGKNFERNLVNSISRRGIVLSPKEIHTLVRIATRDLAQFKRILTRLFTEKLLERISRVGMSHAYREYLGRISVLAQLLSDRQLVIRLSRVLSRIGIKAQSQTDLLSLARLIRQNTSSFASRLQALLVSSRRALPPAKQLMARLIRIRSSREMTPRELGLRISRRFSSLELTKLYNGLRLRTVARGVAREADLLRAIRYALRRHQQVIRKLISNPTLLSRRLEIRTLLRQQRQLLLRLNRMSPALEKAKLRRSLKLDSLIFHIAEIEAELARYSTNEIETELNIVRRRPRILSRNHKRRVIINLNQKDVSLNDRERKAKKPQPTSKAPLKETSKRGRARVIVAAQREYSRTLDIVQSEEKEGKNQNEDVLKSF